MAHLYLSISDFIQSLMLKTYTELAFMMGGKAKQWAVTHFICFTMVLFPDSPAPAERTKTGRG